MHITYKNFRFISLFFYSTYVHTSLLYIFSELLFIRREATIAKNVHTECPASGYSQLADGTGASAAATPRGAGDIRTF